MGKGQKIDWYQHLQNCSETSCCVPVRLIYKGEYLEGWVHATRLPEEQAAQARRRVRANAHKKGRTAQAKTLFLAGWVLVFTTVAPQILPTTVIAQLYRVRWQVELDPRNIKTTLGMEQLRCKTQQMAIKELWVYLLAYNLIRLLMAQSALLADQIPRQLSC